MIETNITLLTGMPRSGTTYIQKLLGTNPSIKTDTRTCHMPEYISGLKKVFEPGQDASATTIEQTQKEFETFVKGGILANCQEQKINLFKSRNYLIHFDLMKTLFKETKYIFVVRDLKDIVLSVYHSTKKYNYKDGYDGLTKRDAINFILNNSFLSQSLKLLPYTFDIINDNKDNFLILKYEDFCLNTEENLSNISHFLNTEKNYNVDLIDTNNYHIDTSYKHTVSHEITGKNISFKKYEQDDFTNEVDYNLKRMFPDYYKFFEY
jgi:hypothetical protein